MMNHYPDRDPAAEDGLYWPHLERTARRPRPNVVVHQHTCPDGTRVEVHSQFVTMTGNTLDRWVVEGWRIGCTGRPGTNETPPDFGWVDQRMAAALAA